jgi:hypothetical protein
MKGLGFKKEKSKEDSSTQPSAAPSARPRLQRLNQLDAGKYAAGSSDSGAGTHQEGPAIHTFSHPDGRRFRLTGPEPEKSFSPAQQVAAAPSQRPVLGSPSPKIRTMRPPEVTDLINKMMYHPDGKNLVSELHKAERKQDGPAIEKAINAMRDAVRAAKAPQTLAESMNFALKKGENLLQAKK